MHSVILHAGGIWDLFIKGWCLSLKVKKVVVKVKVH